MADSAADRQRRYRRHKAGDHSLCDPARCDGSAPVTRDDVTPVTTVTGHTATRRAAPSGLGERGRRLWREMTTADGAERLSPAHLTLLEEACRIADRLERLDAVLTGRNLPLVSLENLEVLDELGIARLDLVVTGPLGEARRQATTLKGLVAEIRAAANPAGAEGGGTADDGDGNRPERALDELQRARERRGVGNT